MTDDKLRDEISLYLYGELDAEERAAFEARLEASEPMRAALETEQRFLETLSRREPLDVSEAMLAECRHDVMRTIYHSQRSPSTFASWWAGFTDGLAGMKIAWQPTAALALLALGFWGGRMTQLSLSPGSGAAGAQQSGLATLEPDAFTDVQSVGLNPEKGDIEIVVEQRRTIRGAVSDPHIRGLLISTVRGANSALRLETLEALQRRGGDEEMRGALVTAMLEDNNPGVRLKALDMLSSHSDDPDVRAALLESLRRDNNTGMRVQAIDLLTANPDRELVGALQDLIRNEPNNYVRMQCQKALIALNASVDLY
jgi:hypothetical protein